MKCVKIVPANIGGDIKVPPSKSISHRAIISAGLSKGVSSIKNLSFSDDIKATLEAVESIGADIIKIEDNIKDHTNNLWIKGADNLKAVNNVIDCRESGSTLRFMIPFAGLLDEEITFTGRGKLVKRPLDVYYKIFEEQNILYSNKNGNLPLVVRGQLRPNTFKVKGNISSQFITGLMFVLPLLDSDSTISITTELESKGYIDLTLDILEKFCIKIENRRYKEFHIKGNQEYKNNNLRIEGDFSQAAFWIVAGILGNKINCFDININSSQGDKEIVNIVKKMGGDISILADSLVCKKSKTKGIKFDASQCPDLVPIVATLASVSEGVTEITNASRLRIKESDRLKAISTELNKLGGDVKELEDGLLINGKQRLSGGEVDSWNDHRIAMSLAVAAIKCEGEVIIKNSEAVKKSYPRFWTDYKKLGGIINERDLW